jgi:hypothetical protein
MQSAAIRPIPNMLERNLFNEEKPSVKLYVNFTKKK